MLNILHTCGHTAEHDVAPGAQREALLKSIPCPQCNRAVREAARAKRNEGLPPLEGDPEDIRWAESIRARAIERNASYHDALLAENPFEDAPALHAVVVAAAEVALHELFTQTEAAWWMEHQYAVLEFVKTAVVDAIRKEQEKE